MLTPSAWFAAPRFPRLLAAVWASLLLARLLLLGHGALADYDERRYFQSLAAVRALVHGNWQAAAYALSMTAARPVDALWHCLPAAGQLALYRWLGWDVYDYPSLLLPTVLNWLTTVALAWFFYRICRLLLTDATGSRQWALVAAVVYASLANTSLYVRHVLPYDGALLLFMGLLYWVLRQVASPRLGWFWLRLGVGAGLLWLFYPGYYAGPVLLVAPLLDWRRPVHWVLDYFGQLLALGIGFTIPLLLAEALSRLGGGPPFWAVSYDLSLHILQGAPSEGYTYLFKYLWQVEGLLGAVLLAGLLLASWQKASKIAYTGLLAAVPQTPRQRVLAAALLLFLAHATAAAVGHRIVWYGRLLHFYLPWVVLAGVAALVPLRWGRQLALGACLAGLLSYGLFFIAYQQILYPPDIIAAQHLNCLPTQQLRYTEQVRVAEGLRFPAQSEHTPTPTNCPPVSDDSLTTVVNFAVLYPLTPATRARLRLPAVARVIVDGPHYLGFPAYKFEGLSPAERAEAERQQFRLQVLRTIGPSDKAPMALPLPKTN